MAAARSVEVPLVQAIVRRSPFVDTFMLYVLAYSNLGNFKEVLPELRHMLRSVFAGWNQTSVIEKINQALRDVETRSNASNVAQPSCICVPHSKMFFLFLLPLVICPFGLVWPVLNNRGSHERCFLRLLFGGLLVGLSISLGWHIAFPGNRDLRIRTCGSQEMLRALSAEYFWTPRLIRTIVFFPGNTKGQSADCDMLQRLYAFWVFF